MFYHNFIVIKSFLYHSRNRWDWSSWERQQYILHFKPFTFKSLGCFIFCILNVLTIAHFRYIKILIFTTPFSRNSQKRLDHKENQTKYRNLTRKPWSRIKILIYRSWTIRFTLKWSTPPHISLIIASHNAGSSNMDQMIPKAGRVRMFPPEVDLSVCWMDFYCYFLL